MSTSHWVFLVAVGVATTPGPALAELAVQKVGDTLVEAQALTIEGGFGRAINGKSFQQEMVSTFAGWQYLVFYDATRRLCLSRRKLPDGAWEKIRFEDYDFRSNDAHNTASLGICPKDGTIHLSWDHHGRQLHYRVSRKGATLDPEKTAWEAGLFGPVTDELEKGKRVPSVTYPRFLRTPEGGLQLCYRVGGSGNGDRVLVDYDAETGEWRNTRQIDSRAGTFTDALSTSPSRCSYPNGYTYDARGRLHATWVWRERTQGANHDLCYAYNDDRGVTWRNSAGELIGDGKPGGILPNVNSPGLVVAPIPRACGLMNTHGQATDSACRIHAVVWYATEEAMAKLPPQQRTRPSAPWASDAVRRYFHHFRDTDGTWQRRELPDPPGDRPKLFFDRADNAILICNRQGDLVVMGATAAAKWTDWRTLHVEKGPFVNEMLGDPHRWQAEGILSVMVQGAPAKAHDPTPLRVVDLVVR